MAEVKVEITATTAAEIAKQLRDAADKVEKMKEEEGKLKTMTIPSSRAWEISYKT